MAFYGHVRSSCNGNLQKLFFFNPASFDIYHKIPKISPGAYNFQRPFLIEGLIIIWREVASQNRLGLYLEENLHLTIDWASF